MARLHFAEPVRLTFFPPQHPGAAPPTERVRLLIGDLAVAGVLLSIAMSLWIASVGVKEGLDKNLGLQVLAVVLAMARGLYVQRRSSHDTLTPPPSHCRACI